MLNFFKQHFQFIILILIWVLAGSINTILAFVVVSISILLLKQKNRYIELLIGFFFILIISDSRVSILRFAGDVKAAYILLLFFLYFFNSKEFTTPNKFFIPFIPFFIVAIISLINAPIPAQASQKTLSYILLYVTIPAYVNKCLTFNRDLFFKFLVYFISLMLLVGFALIVINPSQTIFGNRFAGIFGNPNGIGLFCTICFVLVTTIFNTNKTLFSSTDKRLVYGLIIASVFMAISRNSIFSILIFLLFQRFYNISSWLGFILLLLLALLYQLITMNIVAIISSLGLDEYLRAGSLTSGSGRLVAWNFAWNYIQDHFVFGRGFAFDEYLFNVYQDSLQKLGHVGGVHNLYLAMWLNTGFIGLIFFMYGYFKSFASAIKVSKLAFPIMLSFLFSLTFEGWLMGSLNPYNIGFVITLVILQNQHSNEQK